MKLIKTIYLIMLFVITGSNPLMFGAPMTFIVTNTNDSGIGSLRAAIAASEANDPGIGNFNTINFAIPTSDPNYRATTDSFLIQPTTFDPATGAAYAIANYAVLINGYTQVGNNGPATPATNTLPAVLKIEIRGPFIGLPTKGFFASVTGCVFQGLCITSFIGNPSLPPNQNVGGGIALSGTSGCSVLGNYLGIDITGTSINDGNVKLDLTRAVFDNAGSGHIIGDGTPAGRNVFGSGNLDCLRITSNSSSVNGNYIGTNAAGVGIFGRAYYGIAMISNNTNVQNNLISGCVVAVEVAGGDSNAIVNNLIGTDFSGTKVLGNTVGIIALTLRPTNNMLLTNNIVSGTQFTAIHVGDPVDGLPFVTNSVINSNRIGVDISGSKVLGNGQNGIYIPGGLNTIINGNTIAASEQNGIFISELSNGSIIINNFIGTDSRGSLTKDSLGNSFGNSLDGVHIGIGQGSVNLATIGNSSATGANIIGNNLGNGITIESQSSNNTVVNNFIGVNALSKKLPNQQNGVLINCASNNTIGS